MGINKRILSAFFGLLLSLAVFGQAERRTHTVLAGEGFFGIARQYEVTVESLKAENPEVAQRGLKPGDILFIPSPQPAEEPKGDYTVQAGDTWYNLSRKFNLTVLQLKEANGGSAAALRIGERIVIPKAMEVSWPEDSVAGGFTYHWVRAGETLFGLKRTYNCSLDTLVALNPQVKDGLQVGMMVKLTGGAPNRKELSRPVRTEEPKQTISQPADSTEERDLILYQLEKGDSVEGICAKFKVSRKELLQLNPELMESIEPGRFIVVPRKAGVPDKGTAVDQVLDQVFPVDSNRIRKTEIKVGVLLPFFLDEQDSLIYGEQFGGAIYPKSEVALEFFNGLRMAADSLEKTGVKVDIHLWETRGDAGLVKKLADNNSLDDMDLIIGPLYSSAAEALAGAMKKPIPIVSPVSNQLNVAKYVNLISGTPDFEDELDLIAEYLNRKGGQVILCIPAGAAEMKRAESLKKRLDTSRVRVSSVQAQSEVISRDRLSGALNGKGNKFVVVTTLDKVFLSDLATKLYGQRDSTLRLVGTSRIWDISTLEIQYLNRLQLVAPEYFYPDYQRPEVARFTRIFRERYGSDPGRFSFSGYDTGMEFLTQLAIYGTIRSTNGSRPGLAMPYRLEQLPEGGMRNGHLWLLEMKKFERRVVKY